MRYTLKYIYPVVLLLLFISSAGAQTPDSKHEKIDALRAAFIAKKLNFTSTESQYFWPLYNEMNDKLEAARKTFRLQYNNSTNFDFKTDREAEMYLAAELSLRQKEFEIYKEYYDKFKRIMPVKKVAAVRRAEEDFKKEIIKSIKEN